MGTPAELTIEWIVLTMGDRAEALGVAVASIRRATPGATVTVVWNGARADRSLDVDHLELVDNLGVPGGRAAAADRSSADLIGFLDDDAELLGTEIDIAGPFAHRPELAALALRIVDEDGQTSRRHVPRFGESGSDAGGEVCNFLGGACVIRRSAYDGAGGYWSELWYGHEELDLSWRLIDRGGAIRYAPGIRAGHPRTEISRHADGWRLTGRNRVWIARRNLPWPVAAVHTLGWLVLGAIRTPDGDTRRAYLRGWRTGWSGTIARAPISWRTVWTLTRRGRPPLL